MNNNLIYFSFLILLSFFSCRKEESTEPFWQVYEEYETVIFKGSGTVEGTPSIPLKVIDGSHFPGATYSGNNKPWYIHGVIANGILSIDFTDTLSLPDEYSSEHTGGVKISRLYISSIENRQQHIALHKLDEEKSGVKIYFTDNDFSFKTDQGVSFQFKAGWNFFDEGNKIVTQDINELFDIGYRWRWESWF